MWMSRAGVALLVSLAATAAWAEQKPTKDSEAIAALEKMGAYLRTQNNLKITGETSTDDVLPSKQKVKREGRFELTVRRPDRLRANVDTDVKQEQIFYDGKTFTVFQPRLGYYASFQAPPTLAGLVDVAEKRYGLDLPLADLFYWGTDKSRVADIRSAMRIGESTIKGAPCDHFAFHQQDVDWEIWIERGSRPLPRKLVITTTTAPQQPQHSVVLDWDLAPKIDEAMFAFTPPPSAHRIEFEAAAASGPTPRQGRAPKPRSGGTP
jgi:hypothetical protein